MKLKEIKIGIEWSDLNAAAQAGICKILHTSEQDVIQLHDLGEGKALAEFTSFIEEPDTIEEVIDNWFDMANIGGITYQFSDTDLADFKEELRKKFGGIE